jgi:DNA invertase Pin-like site-specific DNA recombinase
MAELGLLEAAEGDPAQLVDVYIRRSKKSEDLATLRGHLRDIVRWTKREGLQVRHVWFEQLSASKAYVRRLEFEKCTDAVLEGKSRTMAAWKTDRFDRRGMGQVGLMLDRLEQRRARLVCIVENLDSSQPGARMIFAFMSEKARSEAKDIALRVTIGHREHKEMGRKGTGKPPFGTTSPRLENGKPSGRVEPHPDEFPVARRLADCLLGVAENLPDGFEQGKPLTTMETAYLLNAEGHKTRAKHTWSSTAVSKLAQSPLFAGMVPVRQRKEDDHGNLLGAWEGYGEPALDEKGQPRICGTGVVTVAEWYKIRSLIRERTTSNLWDGNGKRKGKREIKYLGTGIYLCGRLRDKGSGALEPCLAPVSHRGGRYRCSYRNVRGSAVCQGVVTLAERVDSAVGAAWVTHITAREPGDPVLKTIGRRWLDFSDPETQEKKVHAREALAGAQARVQKLEDDYYVYGKLSEDRYEELSARQRETIEAMSATLETLDADTDYTVFSDGDGMREAWEDATIADRRMLLRCALGKRGVVIKPAARQGDQSPIIDRLEFDWVAA